MDLYHENYKSWNTSVCDWSARRRANGKDALDTTNAAATVENRSPQSPLPVQKRWGSCWSACCWCFGASKSKQTGHDGLIPEPKAAIEHPSHPPFSAPPSPPVSFLPSLSDPLSIFTIGPYAHETQLVSPPVFSTFSTEPSTGPFTPLPESVHLTTPSSPDIPFARILEPNLPTDQRLLSSQYEFQSYQLQPGSPTSHLVTPRSGTSSPFPDPELVARHLKTSYPHKHLALEKIVLCEFDSRQESDSVTTTALTKEVVPESSPKS